MEKWQCPQILNSRALSWVCIQKECIDTCSKGQVLECSRRRSSQHPHIGTDTNFTIVEETTCDTAVEGTRKAPRPCAPVWRSLRGVTWSRRSRTQGNRRCDSNIQVERPHALTGGDGSGAVVYLWWRWWEVQQRLVENWRCSVPLWVLFAGMCSPWKIHQVVHLRCGHVKYVFIL